MQFEMTCIYPIRFGSKTIAGDGRGPRASILPRCLRSACRRSDEKYTKTRQPRIYYHSTLTLAPIFISASGAPSVFAMAVSSLQIEILSAYSERAYHVVTLLNWAPSALKVLQLLVDQAFE